MGNAADGTRFVLDMGNAGDNVKTGVELGIWLEQDARPTVRRWVKSRDQRVRFLALLAQSQIEEAAVKQDYARLLELRGYWQASMSESWDG